MQFLTNKTINVKHLIFAVITALCTLSACTNKDGAILEQADYKKSEYRVLAVGKTDTTTSSIMLARVQTTGLIIVEDSRLKAVLVAYIPLGNGSAKYIIDVTNKQADNIIARWGWEGLRINGVTPTSDVVPANQTVTFELTGTAELGKIKVKADCPQGRDCKNSSELVLNITMDILPITFLENTAKRDSKTGKITVNFTIDDPTQVDWVIIQKRTTDLLWQQVALIGCDHVTSRYSIKL